MTKPFSRIDGWPVAVGIASDYLAMAAAFRAQFGVDLVVTSGIRTLEEQKQIFLARYHVQLLGNGPYGDVRWWRGLRYVRHSGAGTVAQPGTSNHETGRSLDLADTGADAGVARSFNTPRNQWLSANCWRWGFTHTGKNFREPWHFEQLAIADPFLGRGKPNSISPDDPGEPLTGTGAGGGDEEDVMNSAQEKKLDDALRYAKAAYERAGVAVSVVQWLKARIKGSVKQKSLTTTASEARDAAQWAKARIKGSVNDPSLTAMLRAIQEAVVDGGPTTMRMITDRAQEIELSLTTDPDVTVPEVDEPVASEG